MVMGLTNDIADYPTSDSIFRAVKDKIDEIRQVLIANDDKVYTITFSATANPKYKTFSICDLEVKDWMTILKL